MVKVHSEEACGSDFSELARDLTSYFKKNSNPAQDALERLEQCKEARLEESAKIGNMNNAHLYAYNLVEYLHDCIHEIQHTIKFAETYGGTTSIHYKENPMTFIIKLQVRKGERVYTVTSRGYTFIDKLYE
jgi:hypothetical protein